MYWNEDSDRYEGLEPDHILLTRYTVLASLSSAAEGLQQTTAEVILIDINKRVRGLLRQPRLVSRLMPRASWLMGAMFRSLRAFEELLATSGVGAATLEKGIGRLPITDY